MADSHTEKLRRMLAQVAPGGDLAKLKPTQPAIVSNAGGQLESLNSGAGKPQLDSLRPKMASFEQEMAEESLDVLQHGGEVDADQRFALEAIVVPFHRPVVDVVGDYIKTNQLMSKWAKLGDEANRDWITQRVRSVGRINVPSMPSLPYAGTGFVVGENLLMTNRHVASIFSQGLGDRKLQFIPGHNAAFDFYHELGQTTSESLTVESILMIHPWWDMALLKVKGLAANRKPLVLSVTDPDSLVDREVVVIGYPGYDPNGDEEFQRIQNRIFRSAYYVKRFQPGLFKGRKEIKSFQNIVVAVTHDCSTLGGNSGSALIDLETGHVVGLHFGGIYLEANFAVSSHDLAQDARVVDAGVRFADRREPRNDFYAPIWKEAECITEKPRAQAGA